MNRILPKVPDGEPLDRFEVRSSDHPRLIKHSTLNDYRKALGLRTLRSAFVFMTIRNPWDRLVSNFFSPHRGEVRWEEKEFQTFVRHRIPSLDQFLALRFRFRVPHVTTAFEFSGERLVDRYLKFESLDKEFAEALKFIDVPQVSLPRRNVGPQRMPYQDCYDDNLKEWVARKHKFEIQLGDYTF